MGQTIIEKIIARNIGASFVKPGDIVTVHADRVMLDDIMIPFIVEKFKEMGFPKIWDPDKVVLIYDHLVPASQQDDVRHYRVGDAFAAEYGIKNLHRSDGILPSADDRGWLCEAGRRGIRYRQPYNNLRLRGRFFYWNWLYGNGGDSGNGDFVGKGAGDYSDLH